MLNLETPSRQAAAFWPRRRDAHLTLGNLQLRAPLNYLNLEFQLDTLKPYINPKPKSQDPEPAKPNP